MDKQSVGIIDFFFIVNIHDAGKYMVRAVNTGGEAQSLADFVVLEPTPERMIEVVKTVSVHEHAGEEKVTVRYISLCNNIVSFVRKKEKFIYYLVALYPSNTMNYFL